MTEQEYDEIAAACDRLLRAADTSLERIAIPTLHLINEHPSCTAVYESALHPEQAARGIRPRPAWQDTPRALLRAGRALSRSILHPSQPQVSRPVDVLIVSHLVNRLQLDREDDFYFGSLQRLLQEQGATSMLALVNHLPPSQARLAYVGRSTRFPRMVLPNSAPLRTETRIWQQSVRARNALRSAARHAANLIDSIVASLASRHAWLGSSVANLRLHGSISEVSRLLSPRIVVTTYEGDPCERLIWHGARIGSYRPLCVGYQHARILPRAHAIRRRVESPGIECDPDVILTLGEITHESLSHSPGLAGIKLILYGSHRRPVKHQLPPPEERADRCLVLPDADPHECTTLFEFAVESARRLPMLTFALRPHPGTNFDMLLSLAPQLRALPANATLSTGSTLEEDCASARYCLYRSSSAVMQAAMAGITPFYVFPRR